MRSALYLVVTLALAAPAGRAQGPPGGPGGPPEPPPRSIPGITAPDAHPTACVGCHVDMPQIGIDARLSTAMKHWMEGADPRLVSRARTAMPPGATLTGKHPSVPESLEDVPAACIECHSSSEAAPSFPRLIHAVHLMGGAENHFLTIFQGECTHCHKLDPESGAWSVPSGPEGGP